jgi:hypothetical protein
VPERGGRIVAGARDVGGQRALADERRAKAFALQRQIADLVDRVDEAQVAIELEAVDDRRRRAEMDMFRAEIAMSLDDPPCAIPTRSRRSCRKRSCCASGGSISAAATS